MPKLTLLLIFQFASGHGRRLPVRCRVSFRSDQGRPAFSVADAFGNKAEGVGQRTYAMKNILAFLLLSDCGIRFAIRLIPDKRFLYVNLKKEMPM